MTTLYETRCIAGVTRLQEGSCRLRLEAPGSAIVDPRLQSSLLLRNEAKVHSELLEEDEGEDGLGPQPQEGRDVALKRRLEKKREIYLENDLVKCHGSLL